MTLKKLKELLKSQKHFYILITSDFTFDESKKYSLNEVVVYEIQKIRSYKRTGSEDFILIKLGASYRSIELEYSEIGNYLFFDTEEEAKKKLLELRTLQTNINIL